MMDPTDLPGLVLRLARALWWLGYEFCVRTVGWSIGWPIWRLLTFGHYPDTGFRELDDTDVLHALLIELTGLAALALVIYWLTTRF